MVLHLLNKKLRSEATAFWFCPWHQGKKKRGVKKDHVHTHTHTHAHSQTNKPKNLLELITEFGKVVG